MIKRIFDLLLSLPLVFIFILPAVIITVLIKLTSSGPAIHWSKRIGRYNKIFLMPKFRTMYIGTPQLATHLMTIDSKQFITPIGSILRKTSLDEIPQLLSIIIGDMSFVGPRPALFNQQDLMEMRSELGIDTIKPGLTGWAQINGRDEISIKQKVLLDEYYLKNKNIMLDIKIIFLTFIHVATKRNIQH